MSARERSLVLLFGGFAVVVEEEEISAQ